VESIPLNRSSLETGARSPCAASEEGVTRRLQFVLPGAGVHLSGLGWDGSAAPSLSFDCSKSLGE